MLNILKGDTGTKIERERILQFKNNDSDYESSVSCGVEVKGQDSNQVSIRGSKPVCRCVREKEVR